MVTSVDRRGIIYYELLYKDKAVNIQQNLEVHDAIGSFTLCSDTFFLSSF